MDKKLDDLHSLRKWDLTSHTDLSVAIDYLEHNYNPELAYNVIELFYERMRDDEFIDHDLLAKLMKRVFSLILEGKTADQAFGLKGTKGRHTRPDTKDRDISLTAMVLVQMRSDVSWEESVFKTSESSGLSTEIVARAYGKFRPTLESLPTESLALLSENIRLSPQMDL